MSMASIPTFDIRKYDVDRNAFVKELGETFQSFDFCCIGGHEILDDQIQGAYQVFELFFALPEKVKLQYHLKGSGGARGYTPFKVETAKGFKYADLKELHHTVREIPKDSRYADVMAPNVWPAEVPHFQQEAYDMFEALDRLGANVLKALALFLDLPEMFLDQEIDSGNSILRPLRYPAILHEDVPNLRAAPHEDINLITLLVGANAEGLEILTKDQNWIPVTTE
ncbi:hypothetical protein MYAM1_003717 [Malassezia yamatoensis]|uniref:Non-haem dioxygenase N-terminal domain-containing protein n=1 Tax=Malassezia yamatoensis TaxID=253288 RepID=A0AAJ6CJ55_9BASI|nr:hypothetical protein MYAM1_003717 [Malassezia yamatoensis]